MLEYQINHHGDNGRWHPDGDVDVAEVEHDYHAPPPHHKEEAGWVALWFFGSLGSVWLSVGPPRPTGARRDRDVSNGRKQADRGEAPCHRVGWASRDPARRTDSADDARQHAPERRARAIRHLQRLRPQHRGQRSTPGLMTSRCRPSGPGCGVASAATSAPMPDRTGTNEATGCLGRGDVRMTACRPPDRARRALHFRLCRSFG